MSAGLKFKQAIANNRPLQVVGTINAYTAMMAEKMGHLFRTIHPYSYAILLL